MYFLLLFLPTQKKALQAHKAPKQEAEKPLMPKRAVDARDAREVARKLFKSGAITAIQKPQMKQDQMSFKRPKGQERKRIVSEANVASYQPFSSTQGSDTLPTPGGSTPDATDRESNRIHNCKVHFRISHRFLVRSSYSIRVIFSVSTICIGTRSWRTRFDREEGPRHIGAYVDFASYGKAAHGKYDLCVRQ